MKDMDSASAIPLSAGLVDDWRSVPIEENGELLVAIGPGTVYDDLLTSAVYAGEHLSSPYRGDDAIDNASVTIYVRQSVADRLRQAQSMLPSGLKLIVFDGYRSREVQQALFDQYLEGLKRLNPGWSEAELLIETEKYVSRPSADDTQPSPHSTGGAVDVAIVKDHRMLEFGTPFDNGSERSALRYFEEPERVRTDADMQARANRRLLYDVMTRTGFEAYVYEWWHYNSVETQMGARTAHLGRALFGATQPVDADEIRNLSAGSLEPEIPIDRIAPNPDELDNV